MPVEQKQANLHIRTSANEKAALTEAARRRDQNLSQFVLSSALAAARHVLEEETVLRLSPEAYAAFARRMDEPAREIPALSEQYARREAFREP